MRALRGAKPVDSFVSYLACSIISLRPRETCLIHSRAAKAACVLADLIANYNDGRSKGLYCVAINNLPLDAIGECMDRVKADRELTTMDPKARAGRVAAILREPASGSGYP
jgi:hypothetical protein